MYLSPNGTPKDYFDFVQSKVTLQQRRNWKLILLTTSRKGPCLVVGEWKNDSFDRKIRSKQLPIETGLVDLS